MALALNVVVCSTEAGTLFLSGGQVASAHAVEIRPATATIRKLG